MNTELKKNLKNTKLIQNAIIYQINLRVFTQEGTLAAAECFLQDVAETGADIVYLCPFMESDADPNPDHWSIRQKRSLCNNPRNPYRIKDYFKIDTEYGTESDLKSFVAAAHKLNLKVMTDLVYMHAGPTFGKEHPDFVMKDKDGNIILNSYNFCGINFDSPELREYLWNNMEYWVREFDMDAFRCDVGGCVPLDFWAEGRRRIENIKKPFIFLDEWEIQDRKEDQDYAFDINYCQCWTQHSFPGIFQCGMPVYTLEATWNEAEKACPGAVLTRALEHHDSANDAYYARPEKISPAKCDAAYVLCYAVNGVPFLYNGCEYSDTSRHSIFGNPGQFHIDRTKDRTVRTAFLRRLAELHRNEPALSQGAMQWLPNSAPDVMCTWLRTAPNGEKLFCAVNFGNESIWAKCPAAEELFNGEKLLERDAEISSDSTIALKANGFIIIKIK